ncbi:VOC family protein [Luteolibacter flavescens]|uniref:VOC family protein n=1 Tax=Luteolibacter flavescens TaxID=1859460 RepID=A0ABT3FUC9_9BACT|nr:VOC family protein [Luteolibacter flavescens]MCW1886904.1 VOC family protein [Luteolibacter flavescens]
MKTNALNWFEIFTNDLANATDFYNTILNAKLQPGTMESCRMAIFPGDHDKGVCGALTQMEGHQPGAGGTLVYLNVEGDLDGVLARIPEAGGTVIRGRMDIAPHGFIGIFRDPEGNVVGLHSMV